MTTKKRSMTWTLWNLVQLLWAARDKGIFPALMKTADEQFNIPMKNNFESQNVSVAAGMILYEVMKKRM